MTIDLFSNSGKQPACECGNRWAVYFAYQGGVCTVPMCFDCITKYANKRDY